MLSRFGHVIALVTIVAAGPLLLHGCGGSKPLSAMDGIESMGPEALDDATATVKYGVNLIRNAGAEKGFPGDASVYVPDWNRIPGPNWSRVGLWQDWLPKPVSGPPPNKRGLNVFVGDNGGFYQRRSIATLAADIDARRVRYRLSGWLGVAPHSDGVMALYAYFLKADDTIVGSTKLGPVDASHMGDKTGLLYREKVSRVPRGARMLEVRLESRDPSYGCHGFADCLSLVFERLSE